jgi:restriction system protein
MKYYRIMPGGKSAHLNDCLKGGFIGIDFDLKEELSDFINCDWEAFKKKFKPYYKNLNPEKSNVAIGLHAGSVHAVCVYLSKGDIILCPDGNGLYHVGEISSDYYFTKGEVLPHRRQVNWYSNTIKKVDMSKALQGSTGSGLTHCDLKGYAEEIEKLIDGNRLPSIVSNDKTIEDPTEFALEKHLEDFLVKNWKKTSLGKQYDIYELDGEIVGQQFPSDTGPIDILALSKDKKTFLVVELKKGRVSDNVVGQIQRYMGYVKQDLAEKNQEVKGVIIGFDDDVKIQRALSVANNIDFYKYKVDFKLYQ